MLSPPEQAQKERFEAFYNKSQLPVMRFIEQRVCGCDYGGNSWTTRVQAEQMVAQLGLKPGVRLLDLGAGSGWPGLYLAKMSACDAVLIDLPLAGLRVASERAKADASPGACWVSVADAAELPFQDNSFDAISHSDLLCCLQRKRAVLDACYRAIRSGGRMIFTVITLAPQLSSLDYGRAVENGPEFIESEAEYPALLERANWKILEQQDLTKEYAASCQRQLNADKEQKDALTKLIGTVEYADRQANWAAKLIAINDGLLRRELFIVKR